MDFCAQSLRTTSWIAWSKMDGFTMASKFGIAVSSELMAILSIIRDLKDLGRGWVGCRSYDKKGKPVTTTDLEVAGAMCAVRIRYPH